MNSPQWPGQPPGGPGFPPPPPPHGPPMPGGPGYPPPRRGGGGALVPLLIFGVVGVLALVGIGAFVVLADDDDSGNTSASPTYTPTYSPRASSEPRPTQSLGGGGGTGSDPTSVLSTTIRTAKGNTFTRAGTRTESCNLRANTRLRSTLRSYPCIGDMHAAVYASSTKRIITAVSIAKFSSPSAARSVSRATSSKGWPKLLTPSNSSGIRQPRPDPAYWTRSWTQGSNVIYAQSYWATGTATGGRTGSVFTTAGEIGTEITNTLVWND
ncbi:hypothetical protein [Actinomadura sp. 7K507]|uniref:hypothetical protein n=1 Tax=Actinomadura sp. 7K507 TaxID=2530365 RepID=UPI0010450F87|nr:hypothetical protein [Actinomadura sp. 7K507]TDC73766.1 hypothetical protein E1285_44295 [Actinomadura sp. 7K507]